MDSENDQPSPFGTWPSPISAEMVARSGIEFGHLAQDGDILYWREERPEEDGHGVVVRGMDDSTDDLTPPGYDVRTLVHEYGGGDFGVHDGQLYFANFEDQRIYRQAPGESPVAITLEPETDRGLRYADFEITDDGRYIYCVRENHDAAAGDETLDEPVNELVCLATDRNESPKVVATGHDFYASPRLSPGDERLTWLTWDHPRMPWDGTELHVADVEADRMLTNSKTVMGGPDESVFQPSWRDDGTLHAVSDRTGWWNLYRRENSEWRVYREEPAEYGIPQWQFGYCTYGFLDDGTVIVLVTRRGEQALELLHPDGDHEEGELAFDVFGPQIKTAGESAYFVAGGPDTPMGVVRWTPGTEPVTLRTAFDLTVNTTYLSDPEHLSIPTRDGAETYAHYYPPTNPDVKPPEGERPPLLVTVHGGPTALSGPDLSLLIQFFTSRGIAVADVNYRGSVGYGRAYREALYGEWGIIDVIDCIDTARYLADDGRVNRNEMVIRGGSAGGFVVLCALAFHDEFAGGTSYYGVADLERFLDITHKFESRYLNQLVGPHPQAAETYRERSPVHHADGIDSPVLLLQGEDDPVVPLSQAEGMVEALETNDVPHVLHVFEDEQHGFRQETTRERAYELELAFYSQVMDFDLESGIPPVDLAISHTG